MLLIKNGLIKTMAQGDIENGQVLVGDDGKIAAVGQTVAAPAGCEVIDATGCLVTPGLIDGHCHIGFWEEGIGAMNDGNEIGDPITPHMRGRDGINPMDQAVSEALAAGITTAITGPGSANCIGGTFVAMKLYGKCVDDMIFRDPVAMKVAFGENPKRIYGGMNKLPRTRMGGAQMIRDAIIAAREYMEAKERAGGDKSKMPKYDAKHEAMIPVLQKKIPLKAHAHRADDIFTALSIAKEFDLDITLEHCTEGHLIVDELVRAGKPAIVGPALVSRSKIEIRNATYATPGVLADAGIKVGICTDYNVIPLQYLPVCAGLAIKAGMREEDAWKAVTINTAEICGVADRVGSLEAGKDADIAIFEGNPLTTLTYQTRAVLVDGKVVYGKA